jgi:ribosome biogenesis GTPase A
VDLERASRILVGDLRSGQLGPLTLETPEMAETEQSETARRGDSRDAGREEANSRRQEKSRSRKRKS